jgi:hypothetical protein
MKYLALAAALAVGLSGVCLAQTSGTSDREGGMGKASMYPNGPGGPSSTDSGNVKPCDLKTSGTSDREGGMGKHNSASSGPVGTVRGSC